VTKTTGLEGSDCGNLMPLCSGCISKECGGM